MNTATGIVVAILATHAAAPEPAVGFFDPYAPFSSPLERAKFAEQFADTLSDHRGPRVRGEAYSKAADLARDLANTRIQLGLVNPQFLWSSGQEIDLHPTLVGTRNGKTSCPYALFAATKSRARNLRHLRGRRLAIVRTGAADEQFVFNEVLGGELRDSDFFGRMVFVPDIAGAVGTLQFGRADAFFGPDIDYRAQFEAGALRRIARTGSTLCAVVVVNGRLPADTRGDLVERVTRSGTKLRPLLRRIGLDGFTALPSGALAHLEDAMRSDPSRYGRASPLFLPAREPSERKILHAIEEGEPALLPEPSLLVVERNGL